MSSGFFGILAESGPADLMLKKQEANPLPVCNPTVFKTENDTRQLICFDLPPGQAASVYDASDYAIIAAGSIYNAPALARELSLGGPVPMAALVYHSWRQWDEAAAARLNGDWMFALWNKRQRSLTLARSWGFSSMYYRLEGDTFAFSTNLRALTDIGGKRAAPDLGLTALVLCTAGVPGPGDSMYKEISQLPPASMLRFSNGRIEVKEFWSPLWIKRVQKVNEADVLAQFAELFEKAVSIRLASVGNTGATLSAGLDSGSVCSLAARSLGGDGKPLHAWTSVPRYPEEAYAGSNWLTDETALAGNVVNACPNIVHHLMDSAGSNPIQSINRQQALSGRPQWTCGNYYWMEDVLSEAAGEDCSVVLLGQLGNSTVSWTPRRIPLFPKKMYFPGVSFQTYQNYFRKKLSVQLKKTKKQLSRAASFQGLDEKYPMVNPGLLHSADFKTYLRDDRWKPQNASDQAALQTAYMGLFDVHYHMGIPYGVAFRDPTMDIELISFLLSLPENMYFRDGLDRRVLRLGMKGILPDENRLNRRRGRQGSDILPRIRAHGSYAEKALDYIAQSAAAREMINLRYMRDILRRLQSGASDEALMLECTRYLLPGFSCGFFLADGDLNSRYDG